MAIRTIIFPVILVILQQTNVQATPKGFIDKTEDEVCKAFPINEAIDVLCTSEVDNVVNANCSVHCQCAHLAQWGTCIKRPKDNPGYDPNNPLTFFTCECYYLGAPTYVPPPVGFKPEPVDSPGCLLFNGVGDLLCPVPGVDLLNENCELDCRCVHGCIAYQCTSRTITNPTSYCKCSECYY